MRLNSGSHFDYRPDIDGLRAVAVLAVLGYHAFPRWVPGGFAGVDVFFVISGYLISLIILGDLRQGTFSFAKFYGRRIRRIFPALLIVLAAIGVLGWFTLLPGEYRDLGKHIFGSALFSSNFVLLKESGYFDRQAALKPLLHLWSLAVEEQFYIVWPVLFYVAWKKRLNLLWAILFLGCFSFALNVRALATNPATAFYLPTTRAWELSIGGLLAILFVFHPERLKVLHGPVSRSAMAVAGITCIVAAFFRLNANLPYPGVVTLVPVLGTALLIAAGANAWINRAVLSSRPFVLCGLISFPLYLWHWPLLSITRSMDRVSTPPATRLAILLVSGALALLTYHVVEKPLRFGGRVVFKTALLSILMIVVGVVGTLAEQDRIQARSAFLGMDKVLAAATDWDFPGAGFVGFQFDGRTFYRSKSGMDHRQVWYFGDSHIEQFGPRIGKLIAMDPSRYPSVVFTSQGGCAPIRNIQSIKPRPYCDGFFEKAMKYGASLDVSAIVVGAAWHYYLEDHLYIYRDQDADYDMGLHSEGTEKAYRQLEKMLLQFRRTGKPVYLVLEIPTGTEMGPEDMIVRRFDPFHGAFEFKVVGSGMTAADLEKDRGAIPARLKQIARSADVEVIDPLESLCVGGTCPSLQKNGEPLYRDMDHLRASFVREHAGFMDRTLSKDQ